MSIKLTANKGQVEVAFHCDICGQRVESGKAMFCFYRSDDDWRILKGEEIHPDLAGNNMWITHKDFATPNECNSVFESLYNGYGRHYSFDEITELPVFLAYNMDIEKRHLSELADTFAKMVEEKVGEC